MQIKFDVFWKKNLGTLYKDNEVDLDGREAFVNLDLNLVDKLEANYLVGDEKYTDEVIIKDRNTKEILVPFKSDVVKKGVNEFEVVAYMKNGDIKTSQTYAYSIEEAIGEGKVVSNSNHTHTNLTILNTITQAKVNEWDNKANINHAHSEYLTEMPKHIHNVNDIEGLENIEVDLSDYATINYVNDEISKIELKEGPQGEKGDKGQDGYTPIKGVDYFDGEKGENGITPSISIGNVTTLEPNQSATVTRRGTDENPIFDFAIPKGEKGDAGSGGVSNNILAKYVHVGNQEIYLADFDISTGVFTCNAPHNLTKDTLVIPRLKANGKFQNIPKECFLSIDNLTLVPQTSTTFTLNGITFNETNNDSVDVSKFYFECFKFQQLILDFKEEVKSINVRIYGTTGGGDLYASAYYDGFFDESVISTSGGSFCYNGATAMSPNATHFNPRYFNIFFNMSIADNLIVTNGTNTQIGFNTNRIITSTSIAQIGSVVEFFRNSFTGLCIGSRVHSWCMTNGLTVIIEKCGE